MENTGTPRKYARFLFSVYITCTLFMQLTVLTLADPTCSRDLSDPIIDHAEGQLFLNEAFKIIVEEVLCNGTDVNHKV